MIYRKKEDELNLLSRGRLINNLVRKNGYSGYIGISLLEMEYAQNEAEYILKVMKPMYE